MYRLMIVEDEPAISSGIVNSLPWEEWGFQISKVCSNGEEALEAIAVECPDLVLSDIRMPKMDGLELMKHLNKKYPHIRIVILSGYNDFQYLQTAIKNGVSDYLLKPTDIDEFEEVFRKMKKLLDEDVERYLSDEEGRYLREQKRCNALIKGYGYNEEEMEQLFEGECRFSVMFFYLEDSKKDRNANYHLMVQVLKALKNYQYSDSISGRFFLNYEERLTGILMFSPDEKEESLREKIEKQMEYVKSSTGICVSVGISSFCVDYQMLPQCYEQAKCCVGQKIFKEKKNVIMYYEESLETDFDYCTISFDDIKIMEYILKQEKYKLIGELDSTFSAFYDRMISDYDYINRICLELLFNISRKLLRCNVQMEKVMQELGYRYADIYRKDTLNEKRDFLYLVFCEASKACKEKRGVNKKRSSLASAIREIVDKEFTSNKISLEYVAGKVHKNTAYISKIFKSEFECNFSEYVTKKRVEKSKELLSDPSLKIYEIAEALGWIDVSNYIKVFKKSCGMSPNEYRKFIECERTGKE